MIRKLRVAHRDVPGYALVESKPAEQSQRCCEPVLAVTPDLPDALLALG